MNRRWILTFLFAVQFCSTVVAQNCTDDFLGTKTLYKQPAVKYTPTPAGYQPVFINHVGRHGARHLTKDVSTYFAYKLLSRADSAHVLTTAGERLWQMVSALDKVEKGNTKSISEEGRRELKGLGERMYAVNKNVFSGSLHFNVGITKEIRTKQSADAFLAGLNENIKDPAVINQYNDDTNLRFYDASPVYKKFEDDGAWVSYRSELEKAEKIGEVNNEIVSKFVKADYLATLSSDNREQMVSDVFGFTTIAYSLQDEITNAGINPLDFKSFFTCPQISALEKMDLADEYYKKGPGIDVNGIQVRIAVPLLINFIKTSDEFIKSGGANADLRFAHAETIAPIAALMGIASADKPSKDIKTIGKLWQASKVIPLSANIQWIFYKKGGSDNYLVKILLNEKEAHITGMQTTGVYYNWADLRSLYLKKLKSLNVNMDDDMKAYLTNLQ